MQIMWRARRNNIHALFECTWARLFWQELEQSTNVKVPTLHHNSWAIDLIDEKLLNKEDTPMFFCAALGNLD
jgi:hypothetical protein